MNAYAGSIRRPNLTIFDWIACRVMRGAKGLALNGIIECIFCAYTDEAKRGS